jgi:hypothetical protein
LKEIVPNLSRVAVIGGDVTRGNPQALKEINIAAMRSGCMSVPGSTRRGPKDIEITFRAASQEHADTLLVLTSAVLFSQRKEIVDLAVKSRLPALSGRICGSRRAYVL